MTVQRGDGPGQARGLCILAALYQETRQLLKAHEYYKKVGFMIIITNSMWKQHLFIYMQDLSVLMSSFILYEFSHLVNVSEAYIHALDGCKLQTH